MPRAAHPQWLHVLDTSSVILGGNLINAWVPILADLPTCLTYLVVNA